MISKEQIDRSEREFAANVNAAFAAAKQAEAELEHYTYSRGSERYDPVKRQVLLRDFQDADYMAESRAWILNLIRAAKSAPPEKVGE